MLPARHRWYAATYNTSCPPPSALVDCEVEQQAHKSLKTSNWLVFITHLCSRKGMPAPASTVDLKVSSKLFAPWRRMMPFIGTVKYIWRIVALFRAMEKGIASSSSQSVYRITPHSLNHLLNCYLKVYFTVVSSALLDCAAADALWYMDLKGDMSCPMVKFLGLFFFH